MIILDSEYNKILSSDERYEEMYISDTIKYLQKDDIVLGEKNTYKVHRKVLDTTYKGSAYEWKIELIIIYVLKIVSILD